MCLHRLIEDLSFAAAPADRTQRAAIISYEHARAGAAWRRAARCRHCRKHNRLTSAQRRLKLIEDFVHARAMVWLAAS